MRSLCIFRSAWCSCEACSHSLFLVFSFPLPFFFFYFCVSFSVNNLASASRRLFSPQGFLHILLLKEFCAASKLTCLLLRICSLLFLFCPNAWRIFWLLTEFLLLCLWKLTELKNMGLPCQTGKIIIRKKNF